MGSIAVKAISILLVVAVAVALAVGLAIGLGGSQRKPDDVGNFVGLERLMVDDTVPVSLYKSSKTGLTLLHAKHVQPLSEGVICLRTEAFDNDGLPHTLEHLVFMGSKKYPYKGSLDMIANRCLASGTNAWTAQDATCYTMTTAGSEGFLNLLPIFLDHILNPTLNESYFITEVYHVNGKGEDGGVVFNEMQSRVLDSDNIIFEAASQILFPGRCGYKYETGGDVDNLRNSTNNKKIQKYHSRLYRPENILIAVFGNVEKEALFESIRPVEEDEEKKEREPFEKPFGTPCPPFTGSVHKTLQYPDEEEKFGSVKIIWRLKPYTEDFFTSLAQKEVAEYLSRGVSSPIKKTFVESESPLATSARLSLDVSSSLATATFDNVPVDKLEVIKPTYFDMMENVTASEFDLQRMRSIISTTLTNRASTLDRYPDLLFSDHAFNSFVLSETMDFFKTAVKGKQFYEEMLTKDEAFWKEMMKPFSSTNSSVTIVAKPSKDVLKKKEQREKDYIQNRKQQLGVEGLEEKGMILAEAKASNDAAAIPNEVLETIPIPSVSSITRPEAISVMSRRLHPDADSPERLPKDSAEVTNLIDVLDSPYAIQISQYKSRFVTMMAEAFAGDLDPELKRYLNIFTFLIFNTEVIRNGTTIEHQQVDQELDRNTNYHGIHFGTIRGTVSYTVNVEEQNFLKGLEILREGLTAQKFTRKRLQIYVTKFFNAFPEVMKSGYLVASLFFNSMTYTNESNAFLTSSFEEYKITTEIKSDLENNEGNKTLAKLQQIVDFITQPQRLIFHISGNLKAVVAAMEAGGDDRKLATLIDEHLSLFKQTGSPPKNTVCQNYKPIGEFRRSLKPDTTNVKVLGLSSEESSSLQLSTALDIGVEDENNPILRLVITFFNMMEGPLWKRIRGSGIAYGFDLFASRLQGIVGFSAHRVSDLLQVYDEVKKYVDSLVAEDGDAINELTLQSAKSTLIFDLIAEADLPQDVAAESLENCMNGHSPNFSRWMMEETWKVTPAQFKRVVRELVQPLFGKGAINMIATTNLINVDKVVDDFRKRGFDVAKIEVDKLKPEEDLPL